VVLPDAPAVAQVAASRLLGAIIEALSDHTPVHIGLTGGTLGIDTAAAMAVDPLADLVDWSGVHLWWSDERFLPDGDPERNETGARRALVDQLGDRLPAANVHAVPPPSPEVPDAEASARLYADDLAAHAQPGSELAVPRFDVLVLGVGPDGHIASLFPGHPATAETTSTVVAVHNSPKPPSDRVSFTFTTIGAADEVWFIAAGAGKAAAIGTALGGAPREQVPAAGAAGQSRTIWFLDTTAASAAPA
jgi:6-phosphogluconolactonase